jgi:hypothetical protein
LRLWVSPFRPISRLEAENAALRGQLIVHQRKVLGRVQFTNSDRPFFLYFYRWFLSIVEAMTTCVCRKPKFGRLVLQPANQGVRHNKPNLLNQA